MDENQRTSTTGFDNWDASDYEKSQTTGNSNGKSTTGAGEKSYGPLNSSASGNYEQYLRHNTKNYDNFKYFLEGIDATHQNLDQMTPYVQGISRLFFHKTPYFMAKRFPQLTDNFRSYIETGVKAVSGINDLNAQEATIEGGWANQKLENISLVTDDTTQIEVTLYEQTGSPVRQFIETWMTGIRDPRSGVAHYHGAVRSPGTNANSYVVSDGNVSDDVGAEGISYGEKNHTGEFIYITLDPTAQFIEYACLLAHVWPKNVPKSHLNYTSGTRDNAEMNLTFSCIKYESKYINDIAAYYMARSNLIYNYLEFNPYETENSAYVDKKTRYSRDGAKNLDTYMGHTSHHAGSEDTFGSGAKG